MKNTKITEEIERRNQLFASATPAQKRVLIAQDVIAQVKSNRYIGHSGTFLEPKFGDVVPEVPGNYLFEVLGRDDKDICEEARYNYEVGEEGLKKIIELSKQGLRESYFDNTVATCNVCALGGMFMSCTLFNNKTTVNDVGGRAIVSLGQQLERKDELSNGFNQIFDLEQLREIEAAFEGGGGYFDESIYTRDSRTWDPTIGDYKYNYATYYQAFPDHSKRLIAIMENIVKNNGTFIPEKFPITEIQKSVDSE